MEGLTTGAWMLFTASIGICVALTHVLLAIGVTILGLVTLRLLRRIETRLAARAASAPDEGK